MSAHILKCRRFWYNQAMVDSSTNHAPTNCLCPFCDWLSGNETELKRNDDIVLQDDQVTAFISPKWWINNPGHVIIIPNHHIENIYDINDETLHQIALTSKHVAQAIRSTYYGCTGISTRQHNEPDGNQDVWHFHMHIFPRYPNDRLYQNHDKTRIATPSERRAYATPLRESLLQHSQGPRHYT